MKIGYARVSTQGQTLEAQLDQLKEAGCEEIYREKASGARSDREQLKSLLKDLQAGSTLVVTRLDRLARSTVDLLTTIKAIADKGCLFKSMAEPWADTTSPAGRLMLTVLGGLITKNGVRSCPLLRSLLGVKRTWLGAPQMSAFDPKRTWAGPFPVRV